MAVAERRARRVRWLAILTAGLVLIAIVALVLWSRLLREIPTYYADDSRPFQVWLDRQ